MYTTDAPKIREKHWAKAWLITILVHLVLFALLAWFLKPDNLVTVVRMTPSPDEVVDLLPTQSLKPFLYLSQPGIKLDRAKLCRILKDGSRGDCVKAALHAEHAEAIVFEPVHEAGRYEITIEEDAFDAPLSFDGEYLGQLPSGDKSAGGRFVASFELNTKPEEILTATVFDEKEPLKNGAESAKSVKSKETPPQPVQQPTPQPTPTPTPKSTPTPKKPTPTPPPPKADQVAPVVSAPDSTPVEVSPQPDKIKLTPQMLQITPQSLSPSLLLDASAQADAVFEARDTNQVVAAAAQAQARFNAAYADGPTVGIGERGNNVALEKDVSEYLALMHKEIHPRWAEGYLLRLDTIYRTSDRRLQNPDIEAIVEITLDTLGKVIDVRVVKSSGTVDYDSEAISVAWKSSPGSPPPDKMRSKDGKSYIHWTFWRDTRQCGVFGVKVYKLDRGRRESLDFDLKKVQLMEKQLGLTPSTLPNTHKSSKSSKSATPTPTPEPTPAQTFVPINPLDD